MNKEYEEARQKEALSIMENEIGRLEERLNAECNVALLDNLEAIGRIYRAGILFDNGEAVSSGLLLLREVCCEVIDAVDQISANRERIARLRNAIGGEEEGE